MTNPHVTARVPLSIETEVLDWVHQQSGPGGLFRNDTHAVEATCKRLEGEHDFIERRCQEEGVGFEPSAFWNLFQDLRSQYSPNPRGRVWHPKSRTKRSLVWLKVDASLQKWVDKQCREGGFQNPSHLIETGFRHLRNLEPAKPALPLTGLPFDAQGTWTAYKKELAALPSKGRGANPHR